MNASGYVMLRLRGIRTDATLSPIPEAVAVENDEEDGEAEEVEKEEQEEEGGHVRHQQPLLLPLYYYV